MKRIYRILSGSLALVLLLAGLAGPTVALDRQARLDVMSAVVQVSLVRVKGGEVYYLPWGSGTIVSSDGLILTNCHVADPVRYGLPADQVPQFDYLGVSLTVRSDRPPQLAYLAEVMQADPYLDLAVIQITHKTDLSPVRAADLSLPYVDVGDSDAVEVGDELNIFGYPGIGGETVTFTRGVVSGFTLDAAITGRAWIKTDASISGGNSGGTAVNADGELVGIPTRAGVGGGTEPVDCRPVKDTNGDGRIDGNDDCVPVGGFINALRPVALGKPLIEAARRGLPDVGKQGGKQQGQVTTGDARISNLFFATGVSDLNQPDTVVKSLPSGARSLYLFFDYEGITQGTQLEMKVNIDGQERSDWGMPAGPFGGGENGTWWIGWSDADFVDGAYELVLYLDGAEAARSQIAIGGRAQSLPSFSNIVLSASTTAAGEPQEPSVLFPAGVRELTAFFDYENMSASLTWTRTWLVDGSVGLTKDEQWGEGSSGRTSLTLSSQQGLAPGAYRLNLYIQGELAALSNFWVTGDQGAAASFDPVTFAEGIDRSGNPVRPAASFATGLDELHAFSAYTGMEDGMNYGITWYIDGSQVVDDAGQWDGGESGDWHYYLYSSAGPLPDGQYDLEITVEGQVLQSGSTLVGAGPQPTPQPPNRDGVQIEGTISDLDTGRPIEGAGFIVLQPGITKDSFQWINAEVFTSANTDRQGYFKLPDLLDRGQCYTMIMGAMDYWTYGEDDVCIAQDSDAVISLDLTLEKK